MVHVLWQTVCLSADTDACQ